MAPWTAETKRDLYMSIIEFIDPKTMNWEVIRESMEKKGHTFTVSAMRQQFLKDKNLAKAGEGSSGSALPSPAGMKGRPKKTTSNNTPVTKRPRANKTTQPGSSSGDEDELTPDHKRPKLESLDVLFKAEDEGTHLLLKTEADEEENDIFEDATA